MTPTEYIWLTARTASKSFHADRVNSAALAIDINRSIADLERLDAYKKALFYGKPMPSGYYSDEASKFTPACAPADADFMHGVLGIATEAGELLELLRRWRWPLSSDPALDRRTAIKEELGDLFWYIAMLCRWAQLDFETVMRSNIEKLKARYPDGFTETRALNRNVEAEQLALNFSEGGE
jgi:NTP pyrophosphatase (non-canonical NTP hydrolase)